MSVWSIRLKINVKSKIYLKRAFFYNSPIFYKFVSSFIKKGKRTVGFRILKDALTELKRIKKLNSNLLLHFLAKNNCNPIELFSVRKSGRQYSLGVSVWSIRQVRKSIKQFVILSYKNKLQSGYLYLIDQILFFLENSRRSEILVKHENMYRIAVDNQPFSHYRWIKKRRRRKKKLFNRKKYKVSSSTTNVSVFNSAVE